MGKYLDIDGAKQLAQGIVDKVKTGSNAADQLPINTVLKSYSGNIFGDDWMNGLETKGMSQLSPQFNYSVKAELNSAGINFSGTIYSSNILKYSTSYGGTTNYVYLCNISGTNKLSLIYLRSSDFYMIKVDLCEIDNGYYVKNIINFKGNIFITSTNNKLYKVTISQTGSETWTGTITYLYNFNKAGSLTCNNSYIIYVTRGTTYYSTSTSPTTFSTKSNSLPSSGSRRGISNVCLHSDGYFTFTCDRSVDSGSYYRYPDSIYRMDSNLNISLIYDTSYEQVSTDGNYRMSHYIPEFNSYIFHTDNAIIMYNKTNSIITLLVSYSVSSSGYIRSSAIMGHYLFFAIGKTIYIKKITPDGFDELFSTSINLSSNGSTDMNVIYIDEDRSILIKSNNGGGSAGTDSYTRVYHLYGTPPSGMTASEYVKYK